MRPGLEIAWLAQHPVTRLLEEAGKLVHPASAELVSESAHIESESSQHRLPVFSTWRRMDEVLLANFMVFHDIVRDEAYDLWIGDEAWELDYYLHENPELKTAPYAWLTDFVGWVPMPSGGEREAFLTADCSAEMIDQVERHPRVRDRANFIGNPADVLPGRFGPGSPSCVPGSAAISISLATYSEPTYRSPGSANVSEPISASGWARRSALPASVVPVLGADCWAG